MKIETGMPLQAEAQVENKALRDVSRQFEAMFTHELVSAMRKTVHKDGGLIPESHAERVFQGMLDMEYSQRVAESEQIGLSKVIYEHLLRIQSAR